MQTTAGQAGQAGLRQPHFVSSVSTPCSNMLEREVVFGGENKLRAEIDGTVEIIDAEAYFILTGCTAGIIGDDVVAVAKEYSDRGLPVYPVKAPGFLGDTYLGYETAVQTFLDYIVGERTEKQKDLVNLWGIVPYHHPFWAGNFEELGRILRKLGLRVNTFFTENQGIEEVRASSAAALNIIANPWLLKNAAGQYEKRFGVPALRFHSVPTGVTDTTLFVREVAAALSLDKERVERVIKEEEAYVYNYYESIIGALSWKQFAVAADAATAIGITLFLANDFSFMPVVVIVTDPVFRSEDKERIEREIRTLEYARPPDVFFETDHYEISRILSRYDNISLLAGSSLEREIALVKDIQCQVVAFPISDTLILNRTYAGYRGSLTLVEDLFNNL
jgi:nitrogenase molybdenum-iron protein beta chain